MCRRHIEHRRLPKFAVFVTKQNAKPRFADSYSILQHGLKHRLQFAGRTRNDLQHFRRGGLLLKRLIALTAELRVRFLGGSYRTAMACGLWRVAAQRLGALGFSALPPALSRRLIASPEAPGKGIVATKTSCGRGRMHCKCPLWVKSRHLQRKTACPLLVQKRTLIGRLSGFSWQVIRHSLTRINRTPLGRYARRWADSTKELILSRS